MEKTTLDENFQATINVEKDLLSVHGKTKMDEDRSGTSKKQANHVKFTSDKKEKDSFSSRRYFESHKMIGQQYGGFKENCLEKCTLRLQ